MVNLRLFQFHPVPPDSSRVPLHGDVRSSRSKPTSLTLRMDVLDPLVTVLFHSVDRSPTAHGVWTLSPSCNFHSVPVSGPTPD